MRNTFASTLHKQMGKNKKIWLLTGDLGFGVLDKIRDDYPDRFINCGVAEQNMIGVAAGMAHSGLVPVVYSITPFILYRPFEFIRNLIDHDKANVKLVGTGRGKDYGSLGFTHWCQDDRKIIGLFPNIQGFWPPDKGCCESQTQRMLRITGPCYINLKR